MCGNLKREACQSQTFEHRPVKLVEPIEPVHLQSMGWHAPWANAEPDNDND